MVESLEQHLSRIARGRITKAAPALTMTPKLDKAMNELRGHLFKATLNQSGPNAGQSGDAPFGTQEFPGYVSALNSLADAIRDSLAHNLGQGGGAKSVDDDVLIAYFTRLVAALRDEVGAAGFVSSSPAVGMRKARLPLEWIGEPAEKREALEGIVETGIGARLVKAARAALYGSLASVPRSHESTSVLRISEEGFESLMKSKQQRMAGRRKTSPSDPL